MASANDAANEILARENALMEAKNHPDFEKNPTRIMHFYDGDAIQLFDLHDMQLEGAAVADMFDRVSPTFIGQCQIHNVRAVAGADVAFSSLVEEYTGHLRDGGDDITLVFRMTHGWKKIDGEWKIVHEHWSFPVDAATGQARIADPLP